MSGQVSGLWTTAVLFSVFVFGIAIGIYAIGQIGAVTAAQLGGWYGARDTAVENGNRMASSVSRAIANGDIVASGRPTWKVGGAGRFVQNRFETHSSVSLGFAIPALPIRAGTSARIERFQPGPARDGYE